MEIIHKFLNLVAPSFTFFSLCLFLPPFLDFNSFLSLLSRLFSENVSGKVVLITKASSGIGEQLAYEYVKKWACLALCARREASLQEVAETARYLGCPEVIAVQADVSKVDDCRRLAVETMDHFGRLHHLVNNAGITSFYKFDEATYITTFSAIMDINYWGSVYTTQFAVPYPRNSDGKIIVLSSSSAWLPPRQSFYYASKAALLAMFETLRVELGPDVGVTILTPGFIESEMTKGKHLTRESNIEVDLDMRDAQVSAVPVETVEGCAKAIVKAACRGDRYLSEPPWFNVTYYWKVFYRELVEWCYRLYSPCVTRCP